MMTLVLILSIITLALLFLVFYQTLRIAKITDLNKAANLISQQITHSVEPKFLKISPEVGDLTALAVEVWRIEQRLNRVSSDLDETQAKGLKSSLMKLNRYLERHDIEFKDFTNQRFNEGLNLDVIATEHDSDIKEPTIKETIEPTIMCRGQVIKKAKVVLVKNGQEIS